MQNRLLKRPKIYKKYIYNNINHDRDDEDDTLLLLSKSGVGGYFCEAECLILTVALK